MFLYCVLFYPQADSHSESEEEQGGTEGQKKKKKAKKKKKKSSLEVSNILDVYSGTVTIQCVSKH